MIELKALSAGYGAKQVLHRVSATLERGSLTCVIGPNGCGKSTLLKATAGILPCTEGDVLIDGTALSALKRNEIARSISYLSQGRALPDMTVEQLVLHALPLIGKPSQNSHQIKLMANIQIGGGLIQQNIIGILCKRHRDVCGLAHTARKATERLIRQRKDPHG